MAEASAGPGTPPGIRFLPAGREAIVPATHLGGVAVLKHDNLYLVTDRGGDILPDARGLGLYRDDTRLLSRSSARLNGLRPTVLQGSAGGAYRDRIRLTNPDPPDATAGAGAAPAAGAARPPIRGSLGLSRERLLAGALRERLEVVNYTDRPETVTLELELAADLADIFEVRGYSRPGRGAAEPIALSADRITFGSVGLDGWRRRTYVAFDEPGETGPAGDAGGGRAVASWRWRLAPGEGRSLGWLVWGDEERVEAPRRHPGWRVGVGGDRVVTPGSESTAAGPNGARRLAPAVAEPSARRPASTVFPAPPVVDDEIPAAAERAWRDDGTAVSTDDASFDRILERSDADLRLLLTPGPGPGERYLAAGIPWFSALFGRDAIVTALQLLPFRPGLAVETLAVLGARQAREVDDRRDAEPGKILHELRVGEMARSGELLQTPYYGSVDATPLWLVLLGATYDWTGDRGLVERHWPTALRALEWIDRWGDRDGDGLVEYGRRTEEGLRNQGWKDSTAAILDAAGRPAELPIALAEVQGYVYDAKRRLARLAGLLGQPELAARLEREAVELQRHFDAAFWMPDRRYYAGALDGRKRRAGAITSSPGHGLWSGIVPAARARSVADRLLAPGLFSGWGVRTHAAGQPGYNPMSYHVGSVWPHDTAFIAAGLKARGFGDRAALLADRLFEAARSFPGDRLPELFCGFEREAGSPPVPYPVACSPQAWSAGAPFLLLQAILGLKAHADRAALELRQPRLPDGVERMVVHGLRVGEASADLVLRRAGVTTGVEVARRVGDLTVTVRP